MITMAGMVRRRATPRQKSPARRGMAPPHRCAGQGGREAAGRGLGLVGDVLPGTPYGPKSSYKLKSAAGKDSGSARSLTAMVDLPSDMPTARPNAPLHPLAQRVGSADLPGFRRKPPSQIRCSGRIQPLQPGSRIKDGSDADIRLRHGEGGSLRREGRGLLDAGAGAAMMPSRPMGYR